MQTITGRSRMVILGHTPKHRQRRHMHYKIVTRLQNMALNSLGHGQIHEQISLDG